MIFEEFMAFLPKPDAAEGKFSKANMFESEKMFVDYYYLQPGQEQKPHTHDANDKLYFVLEGRGIVLLGETEHRVHQGQGAVAEAGLAHGVRNDSDALLVLLVVMSPHPGKKQGASQSTFNQ